MTNINKIGNVSHFSDWAASRITLMFHKELLTLNMRGPSYLGLTRSISWLLMPWLLTLPGHQQPWYWLYRICRSFSFLGKDFKYMCQINVEEWQNCKYMFMFPLKKIACKGLIQTNRCHFSIRYYHHISLGSKYSALHLHPYELLVWRALAFYENQLWSVWKIHDLGNFIWNKMVHFFLVGPQYITCFILHGCNHLWLRNAARYHKFSWLISKTSFGP